MNHNDTVAYFSTLPGVGPSPVKYHKFGTEFPTVLSVPGQRIGCKIDCVPHSESSTLVRITLLGNHQPNSSRVALLDDVTNALFEYVRQKHGIDGTDTNLPDMGRNIHFKGYTKEVLTSADADALHKAAVEFLTTVHSEPYERLRRELAEMQQARVKEFLDTLV